MKVFTVGWNSHSRIMCVCLLVWSFSGGYLCNHSPRSWRSVSHWEHPRCDLIKVPTTFCQPGLARNKPVSVKKCRVPPPIYRAVASKSSPLFHNVRVMKMIWWDTHWCYFKLGLWKLPKFFFIAFILRMGKKINWLLYFSVVLDHFSPNLLCTWCYNEYWMSQWWCCNIKFVKPNQCVRSPCLVWSKSPEGILA